MLPCVCSVIDHRWRQNVVRTKKWHTRRSRVCHWCSYHILTSSVIYYWTDARQHGIYLLILWILPRAQIQSSQFKAKVQLPHRKVWCAQLFLGIIVSQLSLSTRCRSNTLITCKICDVVNGHHIGSPPQRGNSGVDHGYLTQEPQPVKITELALVRQYLKLEPVGSRSGTWSRYHRISSNLEPLCHGECV